MIAIKDMEMPKNCADCNMATCNGSVESWNYVCSINLKDIDFNESERAEHCPLVEIVTCKYCKHREKVHPSYLSNKKDEVYFCTLQSDEYCYEVEDDHFCADAER